MIAFDDEIKKRVHQNSKNKNLIKSGNKFLLDSIKPKYSYNFKWLNRPIIQYPQDIVAIQELIWETEPDLIIECGVAHGGSVILSASILALLNMKIKKKRMVLGIDIEVRPKNKKILNNHFLKKYIKLIEQSSIDKKTIAKVANIAKKYKKVLIFLDSSHTYEHVLKELELYSQFVSKNSYIVVFDTTIGKFKNKNLYPNRPWNFKNSPMQSVKKFVKNDKKFIIDKKWNNKLIISQCFDGFLKKIK
tara:strand:- start:3310 stop:4050 length:741 start_codon:yes stop_codon:yes gene_type:complete